MIRKFAWGILLLPACATAQISIRTQYSASYAGVLDTVNPGGIVDQHENSGSVNVTREGYQSSAIAQFSSSVGTDHIATHSAINWNTISSPTDHANEIDVHVEVTYRFDILKSGWYDFHLATSYAPARPDYDPYPPVSASLFNDVNPRRSIWGVRQDANDRLFLSAGSYSLYGYVGESLNGASLGSHRSGTEAYDFSMSQATPEPASALALLAPAAWIFFRRRQA